MSNAVGTIRCKITGTSVNNNHHYNHYNIQDSVRRFTYNYENTPTKIKSEPLETILERAKSASLSIHDLPRLKSAGSSSMRSSSGRDDICDDIDLINEVR